MNPYTSAFKNTLFFTLLNMPCGMPSLRRPCLPAQTIHESVGL